NLDPVRVPQKYPGKKYFKGEKKGQLSCNPLGKNPDDVWDIPNVKHNHKEKTNHPCQFPIGLIDRLVLSMSNENDLFAGGFAGRVAGGIPRCRHQSGTGRWHFFRCVYAERSGYFDSLSFRTRRAG
ncbi:MAG: hypothetical protein IIB78_11825, partial [Proteobacteria bacterium]|nr:hypothetical protein [Pseudomonadota bacterium]